MGGFPGGGLYSSSYVRAPRAPLAAVAILVPIELLSMLETRCVHLQNSVQQLRVLVSTFLSHPTIRLECLTMHDGLIPMSLPSRKKLLIKEDRHTLLTARQGAPVVPFPRPWTRRCWSSASASASSADRDGARAAAEAAALGVARALAAAAADRHCRRRSPARSHADTSAGGYFFRSVTIVAYSTPFRATDHVYGTWRWGRRAIGAEAQSQAPAESRGQQTRRPEHAEAAWVRPPPSLGGLWRTRLWQEEGEEEADDLSLWVQV